LGFHAMADDRAVAVAAARRHQADGAFEAVEGVRPARHRDLEGLVVVIAALVAACHAGLHRILGVREIPGGNRHAHAGPWPSTGERCCPPDAAPGAYPAFPANLLISIIPFLFPPKPGPPMNRAFPAVLAVLAVAAAAGGGYWFGTRGTGAQGDAPPQVAQAPRKNPAGA